MFLSPCSSYSWNLERQFFFKSSFLIEQKNGNCTDDDDDEDYDGEENLQHQKKRTAATGADADELWPIRRLDKVKEIPFIKFLALVLFSEFRIHIFLKIVSS